KVVILCLCLAVTAYCGPTSTVKPEGGVKEAAADGHRHHHRGHWGFPGYSNPIVDRNVCDLDASVLVVVEGGRRGYNKARRVKCADVAAADEDSCMVCCQNAARRDSSIRNEDIFGFLTVIDHFTKDSRSSESHGDDYARRPKRQTDGDKTDAEIVEAVAEAATGDAAASQTGEYGRRKGDRSLEKFEPIMNFRNLKCLCCAPRRQLPPPPVIDVAVPVYQQQYPQYPQYPQPVVAAPAQYGAPAQAQPMYQAPAQAPAQYQPAQAQPNYQAPAAAPAQYQPAQAQPTYQAPAAAPVQANY
ncbi:hypothetical protein PENTCL1PPCAC_18639, partial [Pristionchus entomophagus]